jgi:RIO kinase 1
LSAFNVLVADGRLVLIDLPQVVDLFANPRGVDYLERDCRNICQWFAARGLPTAEYTHLVGDLMAEAVSRW